MKRSIYLMGFVAAVVWLVSSCKIGKEYKRPVMDLPSRLETGVPADTGSVENLGWEKLYTDTVLRRLIRQALDNNKDIRIAAARVREMMAAKRISFAGMLPEAGGKINAQKERLNYGGDDPKPDPEFSAKLAFAWELDLWGNLRWANEAAGAAYLETVEARRGVRLTIVAAVAQAYFELNAFDRELEIVRQTLLARREGVRLAKLRFEGGLTSETPYRQSEVELARTETLVPSLERQIKLKEGELSLLLGEFPSYIPRGKGIREQHLPDDLPVGVPSALLERRPDIRRAEQRLRKANAEVGVAHTDLFPKIRLTGNLGWESDELTTLLKSPASFIAGDLLAPIFAWGKNRAKLKAAEARYEQEVYAYEKSVLEAFKEVNNAIVTFRKTREIRASRARLEEAARTYLDLARLQYINGVVSYIDVLDAQRGLFDSEIGLINAIRDELLSTVWLYKALGGGV